MSDQEQPAGKRRLNAMIFAIIGLAMLTGGVFWSVNNYRFIQGSEITTGTVIEVERKRGSRTGNGGRSGTTYRPTFRFETKDGVMEATPRSSSSRWNFARGSEIEIRYDPEDPQRVRPTGQVSEWIFPAALFVVGGAFGVMGTLSTLNPKLGTDA